MAHGTGALIAMRFALPPDPMWALALVDPLGLSDPLAQGVPCTGQDGLRAEEAKTDAASIKARQRRRYRHGEWRPDYGRRVTVLAGDCAGAHGGAVREVQARLSDMIETQPVAADLPRIAVPTTFVIGQVDVAGFRASSAPVAAGPRVQTVPQAADDAVRHPGLTARPAGVPRPPPQIEAPGRFQAALLDVLGSTPR